MRSRVLLLLLLAALTSAESEPLPPSLVDLVRNSPISSVDELKLLLQQETNAIIDEEDEHDIHTNNTRGRFSRSLAEVQPAQQAACKVRTEVMEVTRSMLDRRNANFMLWPPCVEVQRCSGCCNTRLLQCVATVTASRYLQVIKIQYINRKAHYDKAIISVEDHVSCRCQTASSSSPSSSSSSLPVTPNIPSPAVPPPSSHRPVPLPRPVLPAPPKAPTSKADLHRHDDLKHNQQHEPLARQWQQGGYTQLVHWTQPRLHQATTRVASVSGWPSEARAEHSIMGGAPQVGHGSGFDGSREEGGGEARHPDHARRHRYHGGAEGQELRTQYQLSSPQADSASPAGSPTRPPTLEPSPTKQTDSVTGRQRTQLGNEREESGSASSRGSAGGETDSILTCGDEERRQKLLELVQKEPDTDLHPRHRQRRPKPTAFSTVAPISSSARKAPLHPASPRRRRKHRKRISKAAMRAMIM